MALERYCDLPSNDSVARTPGVGEKNASVIITRNVTAESGAGKRIIDFQILNCALNAFLEFAALK